MTIEARAQELFEAVVARYDGEPGVSYGRMMASNGLRIEGKIFAMLVRGRLVLKLPAERVTALVVDGFGEPFEPRPGRRLKQWVSLDVPQPPLQSRWHELTAEARVFVGGEPDVPAKRRGT
ncbi:MAG: hypothetical protein ABJB98_05415 [Actinomycetota bacterium]